MKRPLPIKKRDDLPEQWWVEVKPERRFGMQGWRAVAASSTGSRLGNLKCFEASCVARGYWRRDKMVAVRRAERSLSEYLEAEREREEEEGRIEVYPWDARRGAL